MDQNIHFTNLQFYYAFVMTGRFHPEDGLFEMSVEQVYRSQNPSELRSQLRSFATLKQKGICYRPL